ncbi:MAG: hypothetical protein JW839_15475 [Candidatus Lokiarchaeota archaeon]|nr:hypothetical protein [Candidatus Lokiarchaeota archaeon]
MNEDVVPNEKPSNMIDSESQIGFATDFETWLLGTYAVTPADVERTEAGRVWLFGRLVDFGLSPGLGFIP